MFRVGNKVICINSRTTRFLTEGEKYTISEIIDGKFLKQKYLLFEEFNNGDKRYRFGSFRFKLDLREIRKNKLNELCSKKEI